MRSFASDNYASIHPKVLKALELANSDHAVAYGGDAFSQKLSEKIKELFGPQAEGFPVFNGTGANVVALSALTKSYEAILCSSASHINVDECGAGERYLGVKLIDIPANDAKLNPVMLNPFTLNYGNEHQAQAKVLSLTQSTEKGTLYSLQELESLKKFCKEKKIKVFMDGARFANAVAALGVSPRKIVEAAGVDILSFGGTKNGLMLGEVIVVLNPEFAVEMKFHRKQAMQLSSKQRYLSAQFCAYLDNDLWLENASHANTMAKKLATKLEKFSEIQISENVEVNAIFARVPRKLIEPLQKEFPFYVWDESLNEVRWMCSFDTTENDIEKFVKSIEKNLMQNKS